MNLLKTVNLRKQFGETRACDGLDFVVNKGEFLSLVGSNGAGKTTLVNLISAHLQPDSGQILLEDRDITFTSVTERIKAGIARSFQIVNLFDGLSVFDNVALSVFSREGKTIKIARLADHDYDVRRETLEHAIEDVRAFAGRGGPRSSYDRSSGRDPVGTRGRAEGPRHPGWLVVAGAEGWRHR